jgi:hypothetical protein
MPDCRQRSDTEQTIISCPTASHSPPPHCLAHLRLLTWRFFSATAASKARRRSASGSAAKVGFSSSSGRACSHVVSPVRFASRSSSCTHTSMIAAKQQRHNDPRQDLLLPIMRTCEADLSWMFTMKLVLTRDCTLMQADADHDAMSALPMFLHVIQPLRNPGVQMAYMLALACWLACCRMLAVMHQSSLHVNSCCGLGANLMANRCARDWD